MKCKECDYNIKGFFKCEPDAHVCIGVPEPFIIENVDVECTEYSNKRTDSTNHKYLRELFPDGDIPFPFCEEDYPDMDERDTFNLDVTLIGWLYERLRLFKDINVIDLEYYHFQIDGEDLTQGACIDRMIKDCEIILKEIDEMEEDWNKIEATTRDLFKVLSKVYWVMWW